MADLYVWLAAAVLIAATYLAALKLALLRLSRSAITQQLEARGRTEGAQWLGANFEVYVFVAVVFFVLSYALSQASYRLERELGVGER